MANEAHKIKLLVLWDILCKNTDENHALNTDELSELLALRGLNVSRKILVQDIATLCDNGYEVLSYKKKYHYYYVVNRALETAETSRRTKESTYRQTCGNALYSSSGEHFKAYYFS